MWINRAKYEVEKIQAKQRIEYLENLICRVSPTTTEKSIFTLREALATGTR